MHNHIVVITGAASGIGKELVFRYLERNYQVMGIDIDSSGLEKIASETKDLSGDFQYRTLNVCNESGFSELLADLKEKEIRIETVIFSAGIARSEWFSKMDSSEFQKVMDINFTSIVNLSRLFIPAMERQGFGKLVFLGSVAGLVPAPFMSAYVASKHALTGWVRSVQEELEIANSPLSTLLISPGFVDTGIIERDLQFKFPKELKPVLGNPQVVAKEIMAAIESEQTEVILTANGKALAMVQKWLSSTLIKKAKKVIAHRMLKTDSY